MARRISVDTNDRMDKRLLQLQVEHKWTVKDVFDRGMFLLEIHDQAIREEKELCMINPRDPNDKCLIMLPY